MSPPDASDRSPDVPAVEHPDADLLADFGAGQLEGTADDGVRRHVESCTACRARLASYDDVAHLLHELPPVQMPDDVLARLEASLREEAAGRPEATTPAAAPSLTEQGATPVAAIGRPLGPPSRWRRWRTGRSGTGLAGLAAAAAVVLLISGVVAGALHVRNSNDSPSHTAAGTADGAAAAAPPHSYATTYSGADYTKASLAGAVPALIGAPARAAEGGTAQLSNGTNDSASGTSGTAASPLPATPLPAVTGAGTAKSTLSNLSVMNPLATQPAVLFACIAALTGSPTGAVPLAVDIAHFSGQPAAVIVLPSPGHPAEVEAWVVGPGCGRAPGNDVLFWERVPRSG